MEFFYWDKLKFMKTYFNFTSFGKIYINRINLLVILVGLFSLSHGYGQYTFARADTIAVKAYYVDGIN